MIDVTHRTVETNGIRMHVAEPATARSSSCSTASRSPGTRGATSSRRWPTPASTSSRPTCAATARPTAPRTIERYTLLHLVGDMVGLLDALGEDQRGDRRPRLGRAGGLARGAAAPRPLPRGRRPERAVPAARLDVADRRRCRGPRSATASTSSTSRSRASPRPSWRRDVARDAAPASSYGASGDGRRQREPRPAAASLPAGGGFLDVLRATRRRCPAWLTERTSTSTPASSRATGFRGGLNWYRNIDRNWELLAPFAGALVSVPALYVAGDRDLVVALPRDGQLLPNLAVFVPQLRDDDAAGLRPLDAAGAPGRGQRALIAFCGAVS